MLYSTRNYSSLFDEIFGDLVGEETAKTTKRYANPITIFTDKVDDKDTVEIFVQTDMDKETCTLDVSKSGKIVNVTIKEGDNTFEYIESVPCKVQKDGIRTFYNAKRKQMKYVLQKVKEKEIKDEFIEIFPTENKTKRIDVD